MFKADEEKSRSRREIYLKLTKKIWERNRKSKSTTVYKHMSENLRNTEILEIIEYNANENIFRWN